MKTGVTYCVGNSDGEEGINFNSLKRSKELFSIKGNARKLSVALLSAELLLLVLLIVSSTLLISLTEELDNILARRRLKMQAVPAGHVAILRDTNGDGLDLLALEED